MLVVGECLADSEPTHDRELDMVDDASIARVTAVEGRPSFCLIVEIGIDHGIVRDHRGSPLSQRWPKRTPCGCVATFQQNVSRREDRRSRVFDLVVSQLRSFMPLVYFIPESNQPHRVEKNGIHG